MKNQKTLLYIIIGMVFVLIALSAYNTGVTTTDKFYQKNLGAMMYNATIEADRLAAEAKQRQWEQQRRNRTNR